MARTLNRNVVITPRDKDGVVNGAGLIVGPDYPNVEVPDWADAQLKAAGAFSDSTEPEVAQSDLAAEGRYDEMTHDGLQEELRRRKEAGADLKITGKQADLIARLKEHDAASAGA